MIRRAGDYSSVLPDAGKISKREIRVFGPKIAKPGELLVNKRNNWRL
jgi:hypothetical protein